MKEQILGIIGAAAEFLKGVLIWALGPINYQLGYLLLVMAIDLVFGIQVARKQKKFSWRVLVKKTVVKIEVYALWIIIFNAFDKISNLPGTARWLTILALLGIEIASNLRNTGKLGHSKVVKALEDVYEKLTSSGGKEHGSTKTRKKRSS